MNELTLLGHMPSAKLKTHMDRFAQAINSTSDQRLGSPGSATAQLSPEARAAKAQTVSDGPHDPAYVNAIANHQKPPSESIHQHPPLIYTREQIREKAESMATDPELDGDSRDLLEKIIEPLPLKIKKES